MATPATKPAKVTTRPAKTQPRPQEAGAVNEAAPVNAASTAINATRERGESTSLWGQADAGDFIKTPRALIHIHRYIRGREQYQHLKGLKPHHILLLLSLAARKFRKKRIRAYWKYLGEDLGASRDSARRWGRELKRMGLIKIRPYRRKVDQDTTPGFRNDRNAFDLSPLVKLVEEAYAWSKAERAKRPKKAKAEGGDE
jgi:hypothetical protein